MKLKYLQFWCTILLLVILSSCGLKDLYLKDQQTIPEFPPDERAYSFYFIGDAGEPSSERQEPVLAAMEKDAAKNKADKKTIFFVGDNIYESGMPEPDASGRKEAERIITEQAKVPLETNSEGFFIPGNHDWDQGNSTGLQTWLRQEKYIEDNFSPKVKAIPTNGCPGPEVLDYGKALRLIIIDTQWLLTKEKNRPGKNSGCKNKTEEDVFSELESDIKNSGGRKIIVVTHHPMESHGPHGGFYTWKDHIFPLTAIWKWCYLPLPVIGSLHPLLRLAGFSETDMTAPEYKKMRKDFAGVFASYPPLAMISGHEHSLEILKAQQDYLIFICGGGSEARIRSVTKENSTLLADPHSGYMRLDISSGGKMRMAVIIPDEEGKPEEIYSMIMN